MFKRIQAKPENAKSNINTISPAAIDKPEHLLAAIRNAGL